MKQFRTVLAILLILLGTKAPGDVLLTEFMASNSDTGMVDDYGDASDWIELYNAGDTTLNLAGWSLTDNAGNLTKWQLPSTNLPPRSYLLVFASNRDRRTPGAVLHTNFKLDADGEFLALVRPDESIATQYAPSYPPQLPNISFGLSAQTLTQVLVSSGAVGRVKIPADASLGSAWTSNNFAQGSWSVATNGIGFESGTDYAGLIQSDLQSVMQGVNASVYFRLPFLLTNQDLPDSLTLRMKFDDGFAAYLNGQPAALANAPADPEWNDTATAENPPAAATQFASFDLTSARSALLTGSNTLAIHGLNLGASDDDFLALAELEWSSTLYQGAGRYFVLPSPGGLNGLGAQDLGPILTFPGHSPQSPAVGQNLTITCRVSQAMSPVTSVKLRWRVMYGTLNESTMLDDGLHGDGAAGDGVYGATITAANYSQGQMVRWYFIATDSQAHTSRWPLFEDPSNSAEYLGTVVQPGYVTSPLPVLHLFAPSGVLQPGPTTSQIGADSETGGRVSAFYDGEFYDNIYMELRGNSTAGYNKKSHSFKFNPEHKFRHPGPGGRIRKTSFTADYPDPSYMRQGLSFWLCNEFGAPAPFYEPWRLQLNGQFYQLANHNDVLDSELLDRLDYDPDGALYKAAGMITPGRNSTGGFDMKTRLWSKVDAYAGADYYAMANAISASLPLGQRQTNLFNLFDLPEVINYMVVARFVHENDDVWANMSVYHDNDGDDLWRIVPFDMNLSFGAAYVDSSALNGIQVTNDNLKSHPLYGSSATPWVPGGNWNRLYDAIFQVPQTREMFLRRMRTFLDTWVKPTGTPTNDLPIEARALEWRDRIYADASLDRAWWGWPGQGGQCNFPPGITLSNGVNILLTDFLEQRRRHFYGRHSVTNTALPVGITQTSNAGIPLPQPTNAIISIVGWDYNPASGNQDEEYVVLTNANAYAVDISGWKLEGGVTHTLQPGTVIPAGGSLYLSPDARAFRDRLIAPKGGMGLFVQGGYKGQLNAWGEDLTLADDQGRIVSSNSFIGTPSLAQQFLRVTELMYNPSPAPAINSDAQQFEYIELRNISTNIPLNLNGVRFTDGITFDFTGSGVTSLAAGQRVLLVRNLAAFAARYGGGALIAGEFGGSLNSGGETLRLEDAHGEKILEFAFNNSWYPITDGLGFSLVIVNDLAHWSTWDKKSSWQACGALNGTPGQPESANQAFAPILVNEVLAHTDLPYVDSIELYNPAPTNVNLGGWFLTDDFYNPKKYRIADGTLINAGGYLTFNAGQFNTGANPFLLSEYGESAYLFSGDANTNLTGYYHGWDFKASPNDVSFGRYVDSQTNTHFVLQSTITLSTTNAYPRLGPIVISEIMYHPPDLPGGGDNDIDEFIELQNITGATVPLYCTFTNEPGYGAAALSNTWQLRNAVDFDFPTNTTLAANARLLVVGFDPTNATQLAAFRSRYNVSAGIPVLGPWSGKLDNSAEQIELKYPDKPDTEEGLVVPYVMAEEIDYGDTAPWAAAADGLGNSLQRYGNASFGNDPTNWFASSPTAGGINVPNALPVVEITTPASGTKAGRVPAIPLAAAANDPDGTVAQLTFLQGATPIVSLTAPPWTYAWTNAPFGTHSLTALATDNHGAVVESAPVLITITSTPPVVTLTSPASDTNMLAGASLTLSAAASDPDGSVSAVEFYDNGNLLAAAPAPAFAHLWTPPLAGSHVISAVARSTDGEGSSPAFATVHVQAVLQNPVIFPFGSIWRYLDNGVDQGTAWRAPGYDDGGWSSGAGKLGFNNSNSGITTVLSYGPNSSDKYTAYYFRKQFTVSSLAGISGATLEYQRDDGVVFYLNGTEILRNNILSGAPVYYSDLCTNASDNGASIFAAQIPTNLLVSGINTLAAEVHQSSRTSSDSLFDARLTLTGTIVAPAITAPPSGLTRTNGQSASFNVGVGGTAPFEYQWQFGDTNLDGATASFLDLPVVSPQDAGNYRVTVANAAGAVTSAVATLTVIVPPLDSDSDGMPDEWEQDNGLQVGVNDANLDADGDGMSNWKEYQSRTDPQDPMSVLKLYVLSAGAGQISLAFEAMAGLAYTVETATSVDSDSWSAGEPIPSATTNRWVSFTNNLTSPPPLFFRVVTPPPGS